MPPVGQSTPPSAVDILRALAQLAAARRRLVAKGRAGAGQEKTFLHVEEEKIQLYERQ